MYYKLTFILSFIIQPYLLIAQVNIHSIPIHIAAGTVLSIKGNLSSDQSITGEGKVKLNGAERQFLNLTGQSVSNIELENTNGVDLTSDAKIHTSLILTDGKLNINNFDLYFTDSANSNGGNSTNFITNNGTGQVYKSITNDLNAFELPIGNTNSYRPIFLTTTGNYSSAFIAVKSIDSSTTEKPLYIIDYIKNYWKINQSGINGSVNISAAYNPNTDVTGNDDNIKGHYFNGTDWTFSTNQLAPSQSRISVSVTSQDGIIYGMNSFVYLGSKSMLEAAYDSITGLMKDKLRWPTRYIPLDDPYRISPYDINFHHVNHSFDELTNLDVLSNQPNQNDNIVDWVFLEIRNQSNFGNAVLSTRSALLQRDGDIVDMDGSSPVFFNYVEDGNYSLSVRHRNHLAISLNPSYIAHLTENKTAAFTSHLIDFTALPSYNIFGSNEGFTTATHPSLNSIRLMKAGNANGNGNLRYSGYSNDRATILYDLNNNENNILTGYHRSDLNMDGKVDYLGNNNDKYFLLHQILNTNEIKIIKQELPQ